MDSLSVDASAEGALVDFPIIGVSEMIRFY